MIPEMDAEARAVEERVLRSMPLERKLALTCELWGAGIAWRMAALRAQHPGESERELKVRLHALLADGR